MSRDGRHIPVRLVVLIAALAATFGFLIGYDVGSFRTPPNGMQVSPPR